MRKERRLIAPEADLSDGVLGGTAVRARRIFLAVWLVYAAFLTTNVARETYLAVALGRDHTVRVDPYLGLHPDLFAIPGRGAYINSNPGASLLGALPYAASRPFAAALFAVRPGLVAPKPPARYDDPRPNRTRLMNAMRERGLDVRLGLAALAIGVGLMAPLGAAAAVAVFAYVRARYRDERLAALLAALYALGTPILFRSAFLNQNVLLAHAVLAAWLTLTWPGTGATAAGRNRRWALAGAALGFGVVLDYSAVPMAAIFGGWAIVEGWRRARAPGAVRLAGACLAGALLPLLLLLGYQWVAFGSPWYPAQRYMPPTEYSVLGWNGMTLPSVDLLWRNLFDVRYGLFAFCPMLVAALAAPFVRRREDDPSRDAVAVALLASAGLWLFSSANQFAHLQWNTGVRYLVPAVPLLFFAALPVWRAMPRWGLWLLVAPSVVISLAVAMMREDVVTSLGMLVTTGPTLPILIVLQKTAAAYAPMLADGIQPFGMVAVFAVATLAWFAWRPRHDARVPR